MTALIADIFLAAGSALAAFYCFILSRRLRRLNDMKTGVGSAVSLLATQTENLQSSLNSSQSSARKTTKDLENLVARATVTARQLELLVASLHSLPTEQDFHNASPFRARPRNRCEGELRE